MKEENNFRKYFIEGFRGNVDFLEKGDQDKINYLDNAFKILENVFIKMSKQNETEEELFYKK